MEIVGNGMKFPPKLNFSDKKIVTEMISENDLINQSLHILFNTPLGSRIFKKDYGTNINQFLFQNIDSNLITHIKDEIQLTILRNEPRIEVMSIDVNHDYNQLLSFQVIYEIKHINSRKNYVFPFYFNEGTQL